MKTPRPGEISADLRHYQIAASHIEWERHARCLERELIGLQDAIRKASNDFNRLAWGSDGNLGADRIIESLEDLLPENL